MDVGIFVFNIKFKIDYHIHLKFFVYLSRHGDILLLVCHIKQKIVQKIEPFYKKLQKT